VWCKTDKKPSSEPFLINIMGRTQRAISEVYGDLIEQNKWGLISTLKKQNQWCKAGEPEEEKH
jgi:hypothetical protein